MTANANASAAPTHRSTATPLPPSPIHRFVQTDRWNDCGWFKIQPGYKMRIQMANGSTVHEPHIWVTLYSSTGRKLIGLSKTMVGSWVDFDTTGASFAHIWVWAPAYGWFYATVSQ
ncbi:hypothetical protein ACWCP6_32305 [Streptomyces sp. NPDC002004]